MKGGKDFQKMQKKNKFPPGFAVAAVGLSGILFMTGCTGEYDVLDKVADSTTVGESITDKINDMVSDQSQNVTYICKRMKTLSGEIEIEEDAERPEYNPETYADTSKADISKFKAKKVSVSDDEVDDYIKSLMREARIYGDETDAIDEECIAHSKQSNYDRQTLNTLLSEMDGFDGSNGVVVIAATNRLEDLDSALTRPGRFDSHFAVSLPATAKERKLIINLYAENKKFAEDVDMEAFAKETIGNSPASIKTTLNEAAIIAARRNNGIINREILDEAWMKQLMEGHLKKNADKDNIELVAWHEAGHALAGLLMGQDLTKASIIPSTSGAGGATFITPKKLGLFTVDDLREQVIMLYAGRNAERLFAAENNMTENGVTTGASNDIEKATGIIKKMITEYGMSKKFGLLNLEELDVKPDVITEEAVKLAEELNEESFNMMKDNADKLKKIAEKLVEKETLTGKEIEEIAG